MAEAIIMVRAGVFTMMQARLKITMEKLTKILLEADSINIFALMEKKF